MQFLKSFLFFEKKYKTIPDFLSTRKKKKKPYVSVLLFLIYCFSLFLLSPLKSPWSPTSALIFVSKCLYAVPHESFLKWSILCSSFWLTTYRMNEFSFLFSSWRKSMSKLAISFTNWLWNFNYYPLPIE